MNRRGYPRRNWLMLVILATFVLVVGTFGLTWWQERPVRQIASLLDAKEFQDALMLATEVQKSRPDDSRVLIMKGRALSGLSQHHTADSVFRNVALKSGGFPDDMAALQAWSVSLLHLEQWPRAASVLEILLAERPGDPGLLYQLSVARIRLRQYDSALEAATRLATVSGREDEANVIIGTIHHDRGNRRGAIDAWTKILNSNPDAKGLQIPPGEFFSMVGGDLLHLGSTESSLKMLQRSVETFEDSNTYALLGQAWSQSNQPTKAREAWEKALQLDSTNLNAIEELANEALRNQRPQEALQLIRPLTTSTQLQSSTAYLLQRTYAQLKDKVNMEYWRDRTAALRETEKTKNQLTEMIRTSRDPFWSAYLHAYQLAWQNEWNKAEIIAEDLIRTRPNEPLLVELVAAIESRGKLPPLSRLTDAQY